MIRRLLLLLGLLCVLGGTAQAQYVMDIGSLITALRVADFSRDLDNLDRAQSVYVTRLSEIAGVRVGHPVLDQTLARRERHLHYLRAIIAQNRAAMQALAIHNEALADVVFLTTTDDGTAMLYVDDR